MALFFATTINDIDKAIKNGENVNTIINGVTPIVMAIKNDNFIIVEELIKRGARINVCNEDKENILFFAIRCNNIQIIKCLLYNKIKIDILNNKDENILHFACMANSSIQIIDLLFEYGAKKLLNGRNINGFTPLHYACTNNLLDIFDYFINKNANINIINKEYNDCLILSCKYDNPLILKKIINLCVDLNYANKYGGTALIYACSNNSVKCITLLLENNVNIHMKDIYNYKAIDYCHPDLFYLFTNINNY